MLAVPFKQTGVVGDNKPRYWVRIFLGHTTLCTTAFSLTTLSVMTFSITIIKNHDTQHNGT
jgi:hypothetical protein